jgi:hypothetical protein
MPDCAAKALNLPALFRRRRPHSNNGCMNVVSAGGKIKPPVEEI